MTTDLRLAPDQGAVGVFGLTDRRTAEFWSRVLRAPSGCWEWRGQKKPTGYGIFSNGSVSRHAHRIAYELTVGPIPRGMELDHTCRNRGCVNPAHMEPVTHTENMRRSPLGNGWRGRTHCIHGHSLSGDNVYCYVTRGRWPSRACKACARLNARKYRAQRRAR